MKYLKSLGIENFKVFKTNSSFNFKRITVLTGQNSSGKTSLTHVIRLLQANKDIIFSAVPKEMILKFNNEATVLRSFTNILSKNSEMDEISISLPFVWKDFYEKFTLLLKFKIDNESKFCDGLLSELVITDSKDICIYNYKLRPRNKWEYHCIDNDNVKIEDKINFDIYINIDYIVKNALNDLRITKEALETYNKIKEGINDDEIISILQNLKIDKNYKTKNDLYNHFINEIKKIENFISVIYFGKNSLKIVAGYGNGHMFTQTNMIGMMTNESSENSFYNLSNQYTQTGLLYDYDSKEINEGIKGDKFFKAIQEIEISNLVVNNSQLFKPSLWNIKEHILKSKNETPERFHNMADQIYESYGIKIDPNKIKENGNYKILEIVLENFKNYITQISNDLNFHFIPSVRAINSNAYSRDTKTYLESVVFDVLNEPQSTERLDYLTYWLQYFGICNNVDLIPLGSSGLFEILLVDDDGVKSKLNEVGYGYGQILPIILKLCLPSKDVSQFVIEEPETNLHPSLQSKLAIFFAEVQKKYRYQLIIETHSEYLIRKLQFLIATKKYSKDDLALYYFYHPKNIPIGEQQIKEIAIGENGLLLDRFGPGFIDEADNIAMDLFHLTKGQNN